MLAAMLKRIQSLRTHMVQAENQLLQVQCTDTGINLKVGKLVFGCCYLFFMSSFPSFCQTKQGLTNLALYLNFFF